MPILWLSYNNIMCNAYTMVIIQYNVQCLCYGYHITINVQCLCYGYHITINVQCLYYGYHTIYCTMPMLWLSYNN